MRYFTRGPIRNRELKRISTQMNIGVKHKIGNSNPSNRSWDQGSMIRRGSDQRSYQVDRMRWRWTGRRTVEPRLNDPKKKQWPEPINFKQILDYGNVSKLIIEVDSHKIYHTVYDDKCSGEEWWGESCLSTTWTTSNKWNVTFEDQPNQIYRPITQNQTTGWSVESIPEWVVHVVRMKASLSVSSRVKHWRTLRETTTGVKFKLCKGYLRPPVDGLPGWN